MGEDQHAAGVRGLDEAERRDRLAGAGRVLEPEALGGVRVLGLLGERLVLVVLVHPVARLLVGLGLGARLLLGLLVGEHDILVVVLVEVLVLVGRGPCDRPELVVVLVEVVLVELRLVGVVLVLVLVGLGLGAPRARRRPLRAPPAAPSGSSGPRMSAEASSSGEAEAAARPLAWRAARCASASSAVSVPESASTWWAERTVPSASFGSSSDMSRSRPSSSENSRRQPVEGCFAFGFSSSSASASSSARRRGEPAASATAGSSPSCRKRSRTSFSARAMSAELGMVVAARATEVDSAIGGWWTSRQSRRRSWLRCDSKGICARLAQRRRSSAPRLYVNSGYSTPGRDPRERGHLGRPRHAGPRAPEPGSASASLCAVTPQRLAIVSVTAGVVALVVVGLLELGGGSGAQKPSGLTPAAMQARLRGSPPLLAALHAQAGELLPGRPRCRAGAAPGAARAPDRRQQVGVLVRARAAPSSAPSSRCRSRAGAQVAFIGIDSGDTSKGAAACVPALASRSPTRATSTPSGAAGSAITASSFTPVTVFFNRRGSEYIHQGPYPDAAKLERDVRRYAMSG